MTLLAPAGSGRRPLPAHVLYGRLLASAAREALDGGAPPRARLRREDGRLEPLPLDLWLGPVTPADAAVAEAATGPVIDVGCGPGRLLAALKARGTPALGVDLSPMAVQLARRRGGRAVTGSVFDDVPAAGSWATALLLDGNIGIGGEPAVLLARVAALLRPGGHVAAEVGAPGVPIRRQRLRIEAGGVVSRWFAWAAVGVDGIGGVAADAGLDVRRVEEGDGRWFAWLRPGGVTDRGPGARRRRDP